MKFFQEAPNVGLFLLKKVVTIFQISCLGRGAEIFDLDWSDIVFDPNRIVFKIVRCKRIGSIEKTEFYIDDNLFRSIIAEYVSKFTNEVLFIVINTYN